MGGSPELGLLWTPLLLSKKAIFVTVLEKRGECEPVFPLPKMFLHGVLVLILAFVGSLYFLEVTCELCAFAVCWFWLKLGLEYWL